VHIYIFLPKLLQ